MIKNLKIFETGNVFGNMNTNKNFYPEGMDYAEREKIFLSRRKIAGDLYGFNGDWFFMALQEDKSGTYFEIDEDYVKENPKGWTDISEDILIVTDKTPGVVVGHPVADCPVVIMSDTKQGVTAIGHCSADLVDKHMPELVFDALEKSHGTKVEDVNAYVSACAGKSWTYDKYPGWATDEEVWDDCITMGEDGLYHIDLKQAVVRQIQNKGIENIVVNPTDTITNDSFYSNSVARKNPDKKGRNFAGAFYEEVKEASDYTGRKR